MNDLTDASTQALWWAVIGSGLYHGVNPGMGWPLAVSAALMERRPWSMASALAALAVGHFAAMLLILLPFSVISALDDWQKPIRLAAAAIVLGFGIYLLINRRHPRFLARVPPHRLALWSLLVATAHGAGLMLLPIFLGLDSGSSMATMSGMDDLAGHAEMTRLASSTVPALLVAAAHTLAMVIGGAVMAVAVYFWLGLKSLTRTWFNLDLLWAASLVLVGLVSGAVAVLS